MCAVSGNKTFDTAIAAVAATVEEALCYPSFCSEKIDRSQRCRHIIQIILTRIVQHYKKTVRMEDGAVGHLEKGPATFGAA